MPRSHYLFIGKVDQAMILRRFFNDHVLYVYNPCGLHYRFYQSMLAFFLCSVALKPICS